MPYKIKYKPTGLFYKPARASWDENLSKIGKTYLKRPSLRHIESIRLARGEYVRINNKNREELLEIVDVGPAFPQQRFTLVSDDSGHRYAVPAEKREEFERWAGFTENDSAPCECGGCQVWEGTDFDKYRVEGGLTFTDPRHSDGRRAGE